MLTSGVVLLQDNTRLHAAACTRALLEHFNWGLFDHPPYRTDLAPSEYHMCTYLKHLFGKQCFSNNEELVEGFQTWPSSQAADFFDTGIQKLVPR
jgi:transposase